MDPNRKKLLIALAVGVMAGLTAWAWLSSREQALLKRAKDRRVLVAARYIPAYSRIDRSMLETRGIPEEYLSRGVIEDPSEAEGLLSLAPFSAGEPVLFNKLARSSQSLASAVPEGRRAYSLAVDPVSGVSGLVRPGDHVDVLLLTGDDGTKAMAATLFQGVQVLAVGGQYAVDEKGPAEGGNTVSLALTPHECEVALFAQSRGRLHLTLRPTGDDQNVELAAADYSAVLAKVTSGETRRRSSGVEIIKGSSR